MSSRASKYVAVALAAAGLLGVGAAQARVSWSVGVGLPGVAVGVAEPYYAPAPVYTAPPAYYAPPPPVYYRPAAPVYYRPPPPVYYRPAPVYYGPPPGYYRPAGVTFYGP